MRVTLIVFNMPWRGTYFRAYHIARELARRGHQATLIATAPAERRRFAVAYAENQRLALVAAPDLLNGSLRSGWDAWAVLARSAWLHSARIDLVHAFECRPSVILPALAATHHHQVPLAIDWCDWFGRGGSVEERSNPIQRAALRPVESFFEEHFRRYADATTTINRTLADRAAALGVPANQITIIPNGCSIDEVPVLEARTNARAALELPHDAPLIAYAGAIFARDARMLAQAFDQVQAVHPNARLLVLGYCNIAIEDLVRDPHAVIRSGRLSDTDLRRYLRAADLGWVPLSDTGANQGRRPLKISTYMEVGLPFVVSAVGDLGDFIARYPAGRAAAPTAADLAAQSLNLLADPTEAARLGAAGRTLAAGELNWSRITDQVEQIYLQLLNPPA
jgi:glycosyltransferase involved in cell wall biosynthesis